MCVYVPLFLCTLSIHTPVSPTLACDVGLQVHHIGPTHGTLCKAQYASTAEYVLAVGREHGIIEVELADDTVHVCEGRSLAGTISKWAGSRL